MKFDLEILLSDIKALMISKLNTKISSINTEKNDSIILKTVSDSAYFLDMDDQAANYDPVILYSITDIQSQGIGPRTSKSVTINIALILSDDGIVPFIVNRMLRYGRCLSEIFEENWKYSRAVSDFKVQALPVLSFQKSDSSENYKVVGIDLITSYA